MPSDAITPLTRRNARPLRANKLVPFTTKPPEEPTPFVYFVRGYGHAGWNA